MRIALLSDIHGNSIALDAVLEDIQQQGGVDAYWILGDLVAIGHDPVGVLERLNQLPGARVIRGNTDRFLVTGGLPVAMEECEANPALWPACVEIASSFAWTQGAVTASGWMEWLAELPLEFRTVLPDGTRVLCVHASPGRDDGLSMHPGTSQEELQSMAAESQADLLCVGHTHWPMDLTVDGVHLLNAGSVSNPFPPDLRASYVMLEANEAGYHVQHRRVPYDREAVVRELRRVNHPAAKYIIRHMRGENHPHWRRTRQ